MNLGEIVKLLNTIDRLGTEIGDAFEKIKAQIDKEQDEKKRKKLLAACARRDAAAIRDLLWN